jgi:outer membrane biosynthesis protein TonB
MTRPALKIRVRRLSAALAVVAAVAATVATTTAAAQSYLVVVRIDNGTLYTVVVDLPPGATLADAAGQPGVPGTPISMQPLPEQPAPPPPPPPPPPAEATPPAPPPHKAPEDPPPPQRLTEQPPVKQRVKKVAPDTSLTAERPVGGAAPQSNGGGAPALRNADGSPTPSNPGFVEVLPGPSTATAVPNFIIRKFRVPPFLLPIYQAAGVEYGVRWEILAAINEIETDYGRNLRVSSAGAVGWMQFLPSSWNRFGVDANKDGRRDPYNPVDAIFSAAHYLQAAGFADDPRGAVFAYNHADWYVDSVFLRARLLATVPADLIGSITGLTEARFPIRGPASYADDVAERQRTERVLRGQNAADVVESDEARRSIDIFAAAGSRVVAVNDGVIDRVGPRRRAFVLEDVYGNHFRYAHLGRVSRRLLAGVRVRGGATLGHIGTSRGGAAPHARFSIRPSGRGAPKIDPKPILDGWQLLEQTAIYRANGENVLRDGPTIGQILLLPKALLQKRVLADSRIDIYPCGREDIAAGVIDRRVLATLEYLAESGLSPTVTSLKCGHGYRTKSGNISEHASGNAVDISRVNGIPILGHQEPGGIAEQTVRRLLLLQSSMAPHQIISLQQLGGATLAMRDHADHIHVGFRPSGEAWRRAGYSVLNPSQWPELMSRLSALPNPELRGGLTPR